MDEILKLQRPQRPPLCKADLSRANLRGANLRGANLTGAYLFGTNLDGADLIEANLDGADLTEATLFKATLFKATLFKATLFKANLAGAILIEANLAGADLIEANLGGANLDGADLNKAHLDRANLTKAQLFETNLTGAYLFGANLTGANLRGTPHTFNVTKGRLARADLSGAYLRGANLTGADLSAANLTGANLTGADFTEANLSWADLSAVFFEPDPRSVTSVVGIESGEGLDRLRFRESPTALFILRERFAKAGLRDQERQVTYARLRSQQVNEWERGSFRRRVEAGFSYLAFDLTCKYGLDYGRPLRVLGLLILLFGLVYALALRGHGRGAIWRVWQSERIQKDEGQSEPERLAWDIREWPGGPLRSYPFRFFRVLGLGLLFSLLSAFQIGWREFNLGNWITRLMPREYTLRATGWVRVVSGIQSLLSVYLLALWALTYFGRLFE